MVSYKSRELESVNLLGERVDFVSTNDRIKDRVENISNEKHVIEAIIERGRMDDVFWDVGACLGIHTFIVAKYFPQGEVKSFEPMPSNRGVLVDNKSVNEIDNVTVFREALAEKNQSREFAIRESVEAGYGRHSFADGDYDSIKKIPVDAVTGDSLVEEGVPVPNIIKIDVEGAGPLVLEGLKEVLQHDECHTVILETHEPNPVQPSHEDYGYSEEEYLDLLRNAGFEVENLVEDFHYIGKKTMEHTEDLDIEIDFELVQGDIAEQGADMIVNSAGTTLRMGTGVAGALREKGGEKLNEAAILESPAKVGSCVVTDAFNLDAEYVGHAVSMPHYGDGKSTPDTVEQSVKSALDSAEKRGCESIVIPMVGCGLGGVPLITGARVIRDGLNNYEFENLEEVEVVTYTDEEYESVHRVFF